MDKLRKLYMKGPSPRKFWSSSSYRKVQGIFTSPNRYFTANSPAFAAPTYWLGLLYNDEINVMLTLYRITLAPAPKPYRIGLLFTHDNGDLGEISLTDGSLFF